MRNAFKIAFIVIIIWKPLLTKCEDDSTLYLKTIFQHVIVNGRNTGNKIAIRQEMRNSDGVLFREVFYSTSTKQVDHVLYYYYNTNGTLRLIEKVNIDEELIGYTIFSYKKKNILKFTEDYLYNNKSSVSKLLTKTKYAHKKNLDIIKTFDSDNNLIREVQKIYDNKLLQKLISTDNLSDSLYIHIENYNYINELINNIHETIISNTGDTTNYIHEYNYNEKNLVDTILTYNENSEIIKQTLFKYYKGGSVLNKKIIGKNNYYLENLTYDMRKLYRELPLRQPQF